MILIIDNYDSFTYNLYQGIATIYAKVCVIRNDKINIAEIKKLKPQGIILSPGPNRPEKAGICVDLVSAMAECKIRPTPLLGVCLGHQAIAQAFGGDVICANDIVHGKDDLIYHHKNNLYQHLSQPFKAGRYHSLIVKRETLPRTLSIDAENQQGVIMGVHHIDLPIYGVQFHPESILTPEGQVFLRSFVGMCAA